MCFYQTNQVYSPETLQMLYQVFQEAFRAAAAVRCRLDKAQELILRSELSRIIIDAHAEGENDPHMLKQLALIRLGRAS